MWPSICPGCEETRETSTRGRPMRGTDDQIYSPATSRTAGVTVVTSGRSLLKNDRHSMGLGRPVKVDSVLDINLVQRKMMCAGDFVIR